MRGWSEDGLCRVLVGADLSPMVAAAARLGERARGRGAELTAVQVITSHAGAAEHGQLQKIYAAFRKLGLEGVDLDAELSIGDPEVRIRDLAEEAADLIVTASHGRSGPARLVIGSVTESLLRRGPCPLRTVSEPPPAIHGGEAVDET